MTNGLLLASFFIYAAVVSIGQTQKPINISHTELENTFAKYLTLIKGTGQNIEFKVFTPTEQNKKDDGDVIMKFISNDFTRADGISLKVLIRSNSVTIHQTIEGKEASIKSQEIPGDPSSTLWVDAPLEPMEEIIVRVSCGKDCEVLEPKVSAQIPVAEGARDVGNETERNFCVPSESEFTYCCLTKFSVRLQRLEPYGLEHIVAPIYYDASYCGNNHACGWNGQNHYADVVRDLLDKVDADCAPNRYAPMPVVLVDPEDSTQLVVKEWKNAIAWSCGCY